MLIWSDRQNQHHLSDMPLQFLISAVVVQKQHVLPLLVSSNILTCQKKKVQITSYQQHAMATRTNLTKKAMCSPSVSATGHCYDIFWSCHGQVTCDWCAMVYEIDLFMISLASSSSSSSSPSTTTTTLSYIILPPPTLFGVSCRENCL